MGGIFEKKVKKINNNIYKLRKENLINWMFRKEEFKDEKTKENFYYYAFVIIFANIKR